MNKCYIIIFNLKNPILNNSKLVAMIHTSNNWAKINANTYTISTKLTADKIRDEILKVMYQGDKVYVSLLGNSAAWYGLDEEVSKWLRNNQK